MANKIIEIEHHPGGELVLRFKKPVFSILPEATRGHLRTARRETLLALRSLLDKEIERVEKKEKAGAKKRTEIEVK